MYKNKITGRERGLGLVCKMNKDWFFFLKGKNEDVKLKKNCTYLWG